MSQILICFDESVDPLWQRHWPGVAADRTVIDLSRPGGGGLPHRNNVIGWRRWLRKEGISHIHIYQPDIRSWPVMMAVPAGEIKITVHLTGALNEPVTKTIKQFARCINSVSCPAHWIAAALNKSVFPIHRISVDPLQIDLESIDASCRQTIRERIGTGNSQTPDEVPRVPLLLALPRPAQFHALKPILWAGAIVRHMMKNMKLVIAGDYSPTQRDSLLHWENIFDSPDMVYLDHETPWQALVQTCDVLLTGDRPPSDLLRLLYAHATETPTVIGARPHDPFPTEYQNTTHITNPKPRTLAHAVINHLNQYQTLTQHS
ncbi:MAG: hypothetical protein JW860_01685 [Sedimentisphaerales bacterium]|nr:hypothetical protein [Sedimentisphaerales bacterium]